MITCYKEEEGERCTILLDIIRTEKEEEEEEEEFRIPACAETVAQIFLTGMKVINSVYRVIGARKIRVRVKMKNTSASAEAAEVTSPIDRLTLRNA
mmetsp:Transcript_6757/g.22542  ORF Transcript_6757/g.22542 Transcript_6757/m.22542 type:complete len:96 (+) Transcript_6757:1474-1761(+)